MGFTYFTQKNPESYAGFCLSGRPTLCELLCSKNEVTKDIYIYIYIYPIQKSIFAFTEDIAFKHFLFTKKFNFFSVKRRSKDNNVYIINFF